MVSLFYSHYVVQYHSLHNKTSTKKNLYESALNGTQIEEQYTILCSYQVTINNLNLLRNNNNLPTWPTNGLMLKVRFQKCIFIHLEIVFRMSCWVSELLATESYCDGWQVKTGTTFLSTSPRRRKRASTHGREVRVIEFLCLFVWVWHFEDRQLSAIYLYTTGEKTDIHSQHLQNSANHAKNLNG